MEGNDRLKANLEAMPQEWRDAFLEVAKYEQELRDQNARLLAFVERVANTNPYEYAYEEVMSYNVEWGVEARDLLAQIAANGSEETT